MKIQNHIPSQSESRPLLQRLLQRMTRHTLPGLLVAFAYLLLFPSLVWTQGNALTPAQIINDEGGPVVLGGQLAYANAYFDIGVAEPVIILEDQAGFVDRNSTFLMSKESQTLGQITSDFYVSPFTYTLALPIVPQASLRDVDNDGEEDSGVMIFAVAYWTNTFGDAFLEERDLFGGGWSASYVSTLLSDDAEYEVIGGKYLVFAPDDQQGFPVGFGDDELLFTEDDPTVALPQGYTVVDMDSTPFTFDRSSHIEVEVIEGESAAQADFSEMGYVDAFDSMIEVLRKEYAFTDYKGIDWDALSDTFRPRIEAAEAAEDATEYLRALRDLTLLIPDGHVTGPFIEEDFLQATDGGLGLAMRELDDGRNLVNFVLEDGPADEAGIAMGAEILAIDGVAVDEVVDETLAWGGPYGSEHFNHLQQLRYALRSSVGTEMEITFVNPGENSGEEQSVLFTSVAERDSFDFSSFNKGLTGVEPPVYFAYLDNGYGYVKVTTFWDNTLLTVQLWERMISQLNDYEITGLIIDVRQNEGGDGFLADQMAAYFFNEPLLLGNTGYYDNTRDEFYVDPETVMRFYPPSENLRYQGEVVVLVGPNCVSACEFFVYDLTLQERAAIVGHYPTAGWGGSIDEIFMPEGESFVFTAGRSVDMKGEIHIEGKGIAPTLDIPVNEETLFSESDPLLDAAIVYLDEALAEPPPVRSTP